MTNPEWRPAEVTSPRLGHPVPVIAARDISYVPQANRFQNLSIYLPVTPETSALIGTPVVSLPGSGSDAVRYHVHVHGGAWRDPNLTARSIEPAVAHAFSPTESAGPIRAVASLNYTLSPFPTHPVLPDPEPARGAVHPAHVGDVLHGLDLLRSYGLADHSYVLSGHSCGACIAFQAVLQSPRDHGLDAVPEAPRPAALLGLNGLYDLPALVDGLGPSHEHLREEYRMLLGHAFGTDPARWPAASPTRFGPAVVGERAPGLVVLDQSSEDQLVPMNQRERMEAHLHRAGVSRVVTGHRCTGSHAAPWERGDMLWDSVRDTLRLL
ncbi:alpha/beta hydrolase [Actinoplanes sp. NPDC020271]|uniref:alpha/beta hydrolase n=1 Tax=Actinoplanes sp. NPDC020271 TaxID=3363896 RepID=UPI0037939D89